MLNQKRPSLRTHPIQPPPCGFRQVTSPANCSVDQNDFIRPFNDRPSDHREPPPVVAEIILGFGTALTPQSGSW